MSWYTYLIIALVILVPFGIYLSATAGRLDRLHHRVDMAYTSLDAQLRKRAGTALALADSGLLDPASALVLSDAAIAVEASHSPPVQRSQGESDLTKAIDATVGSREDLEVLCQDAVGEELVAQLSSDFHRAAIARRFYNDAVRACVAVRRQGLVRLFHLAGNTDMPRMVEMDDEVPSGFQGR